MDNNIIEEAENYPIPQKMWNGLKIVYGATFATQLRVMS